jgi:excisionase family DNA binding protein
MSTNKTERLTVGVEEAGKMLGVSRATAFKLVRSGRIPAIKLGHRLLVPKAEVFKILGLPSP